MTILIAEDDPEVCGMFSHGFARLSIAVLTASCVADAIRIVADRRPDLALIELRLGHESGLEIIRSLGSACGERIPFIVMSGSLTISMAVEAMKLGALDVIEKPVLVDDVVAVAGRINVNRTQASDVNGVVHRPRSTADRWASYVVRAIDAPGDLRTINDWARFVGVSYTGLCETCRLVSVRPHDARDFTRMLRAVLKASVATCDPQILLDVSDARTLRTLLMRSGFAGGATRSMSPAEFLQRQRFLDARPDLLGVIARRLDSRTQPASGAIGVEDSQKGYTSDFPVTTSHCSGQYAVR
jgi:ActR/RegA family two-component response regulator